VSCIGSDDRARKEGNQYIKIRQLGHRMVAEKDAVAEDLE
jgi:hypothetical protein